MEFSFWKWEGAGNDFILLDGRNLPGEPSEAQIAHWCDRHHGIGADGVIVLRPVEDGVWEMDYRNADGTRSFCGNGSRAAYGWLREQGALGDRGVLRAVDGPHAVAWDGTRGLPGVELRPVVCPAGGLAAPPEAGPMAAVVASHAFVDTGSPHHLAYLAAGAELAEVPVAAWGAVLRRAAVHGPAGANVNFIVRDTDPAAPLAVRTFERGVEAETRACGTGATAVALHDYLERGGEPRRRIAMPGGTLEVTFDPPAAPAAPFRSIWLFGPAREAFRGTAAWSFLWCLLLLVAAAGPAAGPAAAAGLPPGVAGPAPGEMGQGPEVWPDARHLTDEAVVSILTGDPGAELWAAWGHTAIRVYDPGQQPALDRTYNFGTFAFGPGFYTRFVQGRLEYHLSAQGFGAFQTEYLLSGRGLWEQPLDLAPADVRRLVGYLEANLAPSERIYRYYFFEDNCSNRVLYVLQRVFGERWEPGCDALPLGMTYREAVRPYVAGSPWAALGIDLILGPRTDRPMPPCGAAFLPEGLARQLPFSTLDGRPLAQPATELLPSESEAVQAGGIDGPQVLAFVLVVLSLAGMRATRRGGEPVALRVLARFMLLPAGLLGSLFLGMWVATEHHDTWANLHLLWAHPLLLLLLWPGSYTRRWGRWLRGLSLVAVGVFGLGALLGWQAVPAVSLMLAVAVAAALQPVGLFRRSLA